MKISVVFAGTTRIAVPLLKALAEDGRFGVRLVITQTDKPAGRKMELSPSPVKIAAEQCQLPVFQPENINAEASAGRLRTLAPDLMVVMAYGQILKPDVLGIPKYGCLNIHGSLLPKYRGASPVQNSLLNRDKETGISLMRMAEKMDAGAVYAEFAIPIGEDDDASTLTDKLAAITAEKIPDALKSIAEGKLKPEPQDESKVTFTTKIEKADGNINWTEDAKVIAAKIRAFAGWPKAFTFFGGKRLIILRSKGMDEKTGLAPGTVFSNGKIATGNGILIPLVVQAEGKKPQTANDFINGNPDFINSKLSSRP
ncbi:methionyl-tRNA formyltransferase [Candidatus Peregrinibacteria bacterium]|nr:methionyl-tRNA formyltransferase [Candidatus Peregrinibacteria bacterium]